MRKIATVEKKLIADSGVHTMPVQYEDDRTLMSDVMKLAEPVAARHYGTDSIQYHAFTSYIKVLSGELVNADGRHSKTKK